MSKEQPDAVTAEWDIPPGAAAGASFLAELKAVLDDHAARLEKLEMAKRHHIGWRETALDGEIWDSGDMEEVRQFLTDRLKSIGDFFPLDIVKGEVEGEGMAFFVTCHITEPTLRKVTGKNKRLKRDDEE